MATLDVYNIKGEKTGTFEADDSVFNARVNNTLLYQMVKVQQAGKRRGTADTKTRADVRGSNTKIYRQKGTGRARHGDKRSPIFVGGGVAFGPHPKDWSLNMPKKARKGALRSALSLRAKNNEVLVLEEMNLPAQEGDKKRYTHRLKGVLDNLNIQNAVLVDTQENEVRLAARNIPKVKYLAQEGLNVYDVLRYEKVVMSKQAIQFIQEKLSS